MSKKLQKVFLSIGEVAEMLDVSPSLVRFWEKRFESIAPRKSATGKRLYSEDDVRNLKTVYHLVKERGMTLAGAEMQLKARRGDIERDMEIAERLAAMRALLVEVRNELGGPGVVVDNNDYEAKPEQELLPKPELLPELEPEPEHEPEFVSETSPSDDGRAGADGGMEIVEQTLF